MRALMATRQKELVGVDRLCTALAAHLRMLLAEENLCAGMANLDTWIEQAGAAVYQLLLRNADAEHWLYFRIAVQSNQQANRILAQEIAPLLKKLGAQYPILGWWWINKMDVCGNALRLRVHVSDAQTEAGPALEKHFKDVGWNVAQLRYEPELCLFGGPAGIRLAHAYFCFESEFLADWMRQSDESDHVLPEGLSLAIVLRTLRAAGLDLFEQWDVFDRLCHKRPQTAGSTTPSSIQAVASKVVHAGPGPVFELYAGEKADLLKKYGETLDSFGQELARAVYAGQLECGLREFLTPLILFHWNRTGFLPRLQAALSWSVAGELRTLSRQPATQDKQEAGSYGTTTA
jgi:thiopeptide-type bacteriocin biosynthesis protein